MKSAVRWLVRAWNKCLRGGALASVLSAGALAVAQPAPPPGNADTLDPPGRVARLSDVAGQVWLFNPDSGEWVGAERNQPLTTGDRVATDANGRAELRLGSTTLRLDGGGELEVTRLDDNAFALELHSGSLAARLRSGEALRGFELSTAEGRFVPTRTGRFRLDRRGDSSSLTVYGGEAQYEGPGSALTVYSNQRADFRVDGNGVAQYAISDPIRDDFAAWNADRDRADDREAERRAGNRFVSPEMTGVEDLDRHGVWEQDPEYGALWIPRGVAAGWAPYAAGHWAWVRPWGWTWIDDAPWGFAPFHYGRWVVRQNSGGNVWCWAPGRYVAQPVYAPALVGWVGGAGFSLSISAGGRAPAVGWFPLAPREVFVPGYRVSPRYVREVNVTHVTNITNITTIVNNPQGAVAGFDYRNRHVPNALTMVPQSVLTEHRPVGPAAAPWRGRGGDRPNGGPGGSMGPAGGEAVVAPPPLARTAGPGVRAEPGRPAWPRGGPGRGAEPVGAAVLPPPTRPFTRVPPPAVSAAPVAPAGPTPPAAVAPRPAPPARGSEADDRRGREPVERRDDRRDDGRFGGRDDRRAPPAATPATPATPAAPAAVVPANPRAEPPRPAAPPPRVETPRTETPRTEAPRTETQRAETPRPAAPPAAVREPRREQTPPPAPAPKPAEAPEAVRKPMPVEGNRPQPEGRAQPGEPRREPPAERREQRDRDRTP